MLEIKIDNADGSINWDNRAFTLVVAGKLSNMSLKSILIQIKDNKILTDLVKKKWFVSKFQSNVDLENEKLIPAKASRFRLATTGFPDYIAHMVIDDELRYDVIGVECKVNGYLSQEEKAKCRWLLKNKVFSKIYIAYKAQHPTDKRKSIVKYKDFEVYDNQIK